MFSGATIEKCLRQSKKKKNRIINEKSDAIGFPRKVRHLSCTETIMNEPVALHIQQF